MQRTTKPPLSPFNNQVSGDVAERVIAFAKTYLDPRCLVGCRSPNGFHREHFMTTLTINGRAYRAHYDQSGRLIALASIPGAE